jgi:predicted Zn-dependent protease with MMP-like domain
MNLAELIALAGQTVAATVRRLPPEIRATAGAVPVCYEPEPNATLVAEGLEPDLLGLFVGRTHGADLADADPLPPQILLFVANLWDYAEGDGAAYRDEVRLTYLHELGHYFGWDEEEIARRGLD